MFRKKLLILKVTEPVSDIRSVGTEQRRDSKYNMCVVRQERRDVRKGTGGRNILQMPLPL
jgi:hypothetical protein